VNDDDFIQLLRATAPKPRAEFTEALDLRVARGFREPASREHAASMSWLQRLAGHGRTMQRRWIIGTSLAATACAVLLIAVVGVRLDDGSQNDSFTSAPATTEQSGPAIDSERGAAMSAETSGATGDFAKSVPARAPSSAATSASKVAAPDRQHILGAGIFVTVEPKRVPDVVAKSTKVAQSLGGYVGDSSYNVTDGTATGTAELWVPTSKNAIAMARLARLGTVERTTQGSRDVTDARATDEQQLAATQEQLRQLGPKASQAQRDALEQQIAAQQARLDNLDARIAMSHISFHVTGAHHAPTADKPAEPWTIQWAWDRTGDILSHLAAAAILVAAVLFAPLIAAILLWLGFAARRRRQRERTLDDE
jgi:hypothetical protein